MDEQQIVVDDPVILVVWLSFYEPNIKMTEPEAQILLNYMKDHDYAMIVQGDKMLRMDLAEENGEIEPYDIDDVIDMACEWNYELLFDAKERMENPENFIDFCNYSNSYKALQEDEPVLSRLFEQTRYGRAVQELVEKVIAKTSVVGMPDMEYVVRTPIYPSLNNSVSAEEHKAGKVR